MNEVARQSYQPTSPFVDPLLRVAVERFVAAWRAGQRPLIEATYALTKETDRGERQSRKNSAG